MTKVDNRKADLAKIHIARKDLNMDDPTYRALLLRITAKESSADLDVVERSKVLAEFKRLGWKPKPKHKRGGWVKSNGHTYKKATSKKIIVLWGQLFDAELVSDKRVTAMCKWIDGQFGKKNPDWLSDDESYQAIERLKQWLKRGSGDD